MLYLLKNKICRKGKLFNIDKASLLNKSYKINNNFQILLIFYYKVKDNKN